MLKLLNSQTLNAREICWSASDDDDDGGNSNLHEIDYFWEKLVFHKSSLLRSPSYDVTISGK